jgi:hypothetical protein
MSIGVLDRAEAVRAWPHALQKRLPGGLLWLQLAQTARSDAPQPLQNRASGGLSVPQAEHAIARHPGSSIA